MEKLKGWYYLYDNRELDAFTEWKAENPEKNQRDCPLGYPVVRTDIRELNDNEVKVYLDKGIHIYKLHLGKEVITKKKK